MVDFNLTLNHPKRCCLWDSVLRHVIHNLATRDQALCQPVLFLTVIVRLIISTTGYSLSVFLTKVTLRTYCTLDRK